MKVVNIIDLKPVISDIPSDWICCSISQEYRPKEEFRSDGNSYQSRTNCTRTYKMPSKELEELRSATNLVIKSYLYKRMKDDLINSVTAKAESIPATSMIEILKSLIEKHGDTVRVCMTQAGYYADGKFGCIGLDDNVQMIDVDGSLVFSIGHSSQNC